MSIVTPPEVTPARQAFYEKLSESNLAPLWMVFSTLISRRPKSQCKAHLWNYDDLKPLLLEAGDLITAKEAERRVLVLENPGLAGTSKITTSLYAGLQLVLPGEVAPAHRHSQSALRFVVDGSGAYTAVAGERTLMEAGDFVITPPWAWHDHGNDSSAPMVWLDGLDIPIVSFFDASFAEPFGADEQPVTRQTNDSLARYGANMLPVDFETNDLASPLFNYPYTRTREALEQMQKQDEWDPWHGLKLRYVNPVDGNAAIPTLSTFMQLLPTGFVTEPYQSTDATVFSVVEGSGRSIIGGSFFEWKARDTFVVPSWQQVVHEANTESVLFSFSDRVCQQKLGLFRENRIEQ
jgi:gentisate 1,2-dioxygenase